MKVRPWSDKIWFSPRFIVDYLAKAGGKANKEQMKRLKEAWICAVGIICRAEKEATEWWIQLPKQDPPDVLAMKLVPTADGTSQDISQLQVEVFELSQHDAEPVSDSIKRKLTHQDYSGYVVIGFLMRASLFDLQAIAKEVNDMSPKVGSLNLLIFEHPEARAVVTFVQLYPTLIKVKVDFGKYCRESKQDDFIDVKRSTILSTHTDSTTDALTVVP